MNSNSIDREQSFQTTVNRDSYLLVVNTSSSPIGIGVSRSWTCVDDIVKSGLCVSAEPRHSASTGNRNPILWIEVVGGTLDPKNWTKDCGGGGRRARACPGIPSWSALVRVADERMSRGTTSVPPSTGGDPSKFKHGGASVMLGRFRERFSKALCESLEIRSSRGPPFRETWPGNPIFWIEVVGGTLDPKNWIKT